MPAPIRKNRTEQMGKVYPNTNLVTDPATRQSLVLLWDRLQTCEEIVATLTLRLSSVESAVDLAQQTAESAQTSANVLASAGSLTSPGFGSGDPDRNPWQDFGQGVAGLANAGSTGHVAPGAPLTPYTVGQIVGGVAKEFPALLAPTVSGAARDANLAELLSRTIWHLNLAGFTAGKNLTSGGGISYDAFVFFNAGIPRGYIMLRYDQFDFLGFGDFTIPAYVQMEILNINETNYVVDGGTPD